MIDVTAATAAVQKIDDAVGTIGKLVGRLKGQPDVAAVKVAEALDEVTKTWQVMDEVITDYLKLGIDDDALQKGSATLLKIEGGGLSVRVEQGRGHCHIIGNIFEKYLDRWFDRVLKGPELDQIRHVFYMFSKSDVDVFEQMVYVADQLQTEANSVLDMVVNSELDKARAMVLKSRTELLPLRLAISGAMERLYSLRSEFIKIANVA